MDQNWAFGYFFYDIMVSSKLVISISLYLGLLNSINTKDRLYKILVQTDTNNILYETMRLNLKTYQRILKNSIKEAKRVYHFNLFSKYKADVKKTWSIIKDTLGKQIHKK